MGGIFSKPKAPEPFKPTETQKELERSQLETTASQKSEIAERSARAGTRRMGRRSLLTGSATGVEEEKKTTMG